MTKTPKRSSSKAKPPRVKKAWLAFLDEHPKLYSGAIGFRAALPGGATPTAFVRGEVTMLASGAWETMALSAGGQTLIVVALAEAGDFAALQARFKGKPVTPTVKGSLGEFSVVLP